MRFVTRLRRGLTLAVAASSMAAWTTRAAGAGQEPQDCETVTSVEELEQSAQTIFAAYGQGNAQEPALKAELQQGILRVTAPPYSADPTGTNDSADAIQAAVCDARDSRAICFFPPGGDEARRAGPRGNPRVGEQFRIEVQLSRKPGDVRGARTIQYELDAHLPPSPGRDRLLFACNRRPGQHGRRQNDHQNAHQNMISLLDHLSPSSPGIARRRLLRCLASS